MSLITELVKRLRNEATDMILQMQNRTTIGLLKEAADTIEQLSAKLQVANMERSTAYYNGGWIPVSERLPEEGKEVLVSGYDTYNKKVIIARYQGEQYGFTCGLVSAWMPLPEPYKAKSEG